MHRWRPSRKGWRPSSQAMESSMLLPRRREQANLKQIYCLLQLKNPSWNTTSHRVHTTAICKVNLIMESAIPPAMTMYLVVNQVSLTIYPTTLLFLLSLWNCKLQFPPTHVDPSTVSASADLGVPVIQTPAAGRIYQEQYAAFSPVSAFLQNFRHDHSLGPRTDNVIYRFHPRS